MRLWNYLKDKMLQHRSQVVSEENASMTFEEIIIYAETLSKKLYGVKCCGILCQSEMMAAISLLACFAAGVTALPLSLRYGELHCKKILDFISPDAILTDLNGEIEVASITKSKYIEPEAHPALIMCTSGTTGTPKGVMLTETNILTNVSDISDYFGINEKDHILIARPLYHCAVLTGEFLTALVKGTGIRFYSGAFHPAAVLSLVKKHNISALCGTPTLLSIMARYNRNREGDSLKHICVSGECMSFETGTRISKAFPDAGIYHIYGLTEACPRVSYLPPSLFNDHADCVGIPLKHVALKIITSQGKPAGVNEIGVLWVKGDNVMMGYYNDCARTTQVIQEGWLCTGDLSLINEAGLLKILGRNDDLIIRAGMNIYPQEVEGALRTDPRVHEVYVHGELDEKYGTQIVLNISGEFSDLLEVKELCKKWLPAYQMPTKFNLLPEIPKNGSGKIMRRRENAGIRKENSAN